MKRHANPMRAYHRATRVRHCSVCGGSGHDARAHSKAKRGPKKKRNPVGPVWDVAANVIGGHIYQKYLDHRGKIGGGKKHKYL